MNLDLRCLQEIEKQIGEQLEKHAAELVTGKAIDWADVRFRVGVIKGLRDALAIAKNVNEDILGVQREER